MKGIILAGGSGTRLYPITLVTSKQLLPIYDKPMIYYPLSVLMLAKIKEILIISTPEDIKKYESLLKDGKQYGLNIQYAVQKKPNGLAQAFVIGKEFIGKDSVCLILGDNIFYGQGFSEQLETAVENTKKNNATIFGYYVNQPEDFGVAVFDENENVIEIEEKPKKPKSNYAIPGLYFYPNSVISIAESIKPSSRGEYEITSVNNEYLKRNELKLERMGRGLAWLDTGTYEGLLSASNYVHTVQSIQGLYIACLEEIAYRSNFITKEELLIQAKKLAKTSYGKYLIKISEEK